MSATSPGQTSPQADTPLADTPWADTLLAESPWADTSCPVHARIHPPACLPFRLAIKSYEVEVIGRDQMKRVFAGSCCEYVQEQLPTQGYSE